VEFVELSDGVRLRTWTTGTPTSAPPVILLHGGPGLWDYLEPVADLMSDLTVVHRFDQRGCGGSDPSAEQTMQRLQADIDELRKHWGHDEFVVIGHSFGATLALTYAAAYPDHARAVGYLSGVGIGDWQTPYHQERRRRMSPDQQSRLDLLERSPERTPAQEQQFRALSWFTDHADRANAWAWALEDAAVPSPINFAANRVLSAETDSWTDDDLARTARSLEMPVWFVHGSGDPRPASAVESLAGRVPNAELHVIEAAGHEPWRERPSEFRAIWVNFLERVG
jgi:proline iminopeptidase